MGKRYEAEKKKVGAPDGNQNAQKQWSQAGTIVSPSRTAERIAVERGITRHTVERAADFARAVDILAADSPTIKRKILSGEIDQPRTKIIEIAAKPDAARRAAVEGEGPPAAFPIRECTAGGRTPAGNFVTIRGYFVTIEGGFVTVLIGQIKAFRSNFVILSLLSPRVAYSVTHPYKYI